LASQRRGLGLLLVVALMQHLLQLLKEAAPGLRSVALFVNPTNEAVAQFVKHVLADAAPIGMQVQVVEVSSPSEFEARVRSHLPGKHGIDIASSGTIDLIQTRRNRRTRRSLTGHQLTSADAD